MEAKKFIQQKLSEIQKKQQELLVQRQRQADDMGQKPITVTRYRNGISIMRFPIFSTNYARNGRQQECIRYNDPVNGINFEVSPNAKYGMPDQVDGNVLRLIISKAREVHYSMGVCPTSIDLRRYEILQTLNLSTGGNDYKALHDRLNRLAGTQYYGNIFYKEKTFGGTLFSFDYPTNDKDPNGVVRINLDPSFKAYLDDHKSVLAIADDIMKLRSPLEIRLRELVQVHMGSKKTWSIGLAKIFKLCSLDSPLKEFKRNIRNADIPYFVSFTGSRKLANQLVVFTVKEPQPDSISPIIDALVKS